MKNPFSRTHAIETLRMVVSRVSYSASIDKLPEEFAEVISLYDRSPLDANFRSDIHSLLSGAVEVAKSMMDTTFDADTAIRAVSDQITTLSRVLNYLSSRPTRVGYSILSPSSGTLLGQFSSEGEAAGHLADLRNLGHANNALVVPVKIISQYSIQPAPREPLTGDIPQAILPLTETHIHDPIELDAPSAPQPPRSTFKPPTPT